MKWQDSLKLMALFMSFWEIKYIKIIASCRSSVWALNVLICRQSISLAAYINYICLILYFFLLLNLLTRNDWSYYCTHLENTRMVYHLILVENFYIAFTYLIPFHHCLSKSCYSGHWYRKGLNLYCCYIHWKEKQRDIIYSLGR